MPRGGAPLRAGIAQTSISPSDDRIENNRGPRAAPMKNAARGITGDCGAFLPLPRTALLGGEGRGEGEDSSDSRSGSGIRDACPLTPSLSPKQKALGGEGEQFVALLAFVSRPPEPRRRRRKQPVDQLHAIGVVVLQPQRSIEVDELRFARDFQRRRDAERRADH